MKIVKKYSYKLTEDNLEKDMDKFFDKARNGDYGWDYKYGMEGLKIIKQYFRLIQEEFDTGNFPYCKLCYKRLLFFLFEASTENNYFNYEDLLGRTKLDFEKIVKNYVICLLKTCSNEELSREIIEFIKAKSEYGFDSFLDTLLESLDKDSIQKIENIMFSDIEDMTKKDYKKHDIFYFLLDIAFSHRDKDKYISLCDKFKSAFSQQELEFMKREYDEDILEIFKSMKDNKNGTPK